MIRLALFPPAAALFATDLRQIKSPGFNTIRCPVPPASATDLSPAGGRRFRKVRDAARARRGPRSEARLIPMRYADGTYFEWEPQP